MESYCVIQFKDKQEKGKILTFLAVETEAEYKVTADLKGFVAKQFNVTILENDTFQTDQHSPFLTPDSIVADQPIPVIDNAQNLMNMDNYGTLVPYLERLIEPKQEIMEDEEVSVDTNGDGLIGNDVVDNISVDAVVTSDQADTPSSSTTTKLRKSTKRPRHSIDEDSDEEDTSVIKHAAVAGGKPKKSTCNKCGTKVASRYFAKREHAIVHTEIMAFKCLVDGCGLGYKSRSNTRRHMKAKHKTQLNSFAKIELTSEQNATIDSVLKECFDDSEKDSVDKCQMCHQDVGGSSFNQFNYKMEHALHHLELMLYTCTERRCSFESKTKRGMKTHVRCVHPKIANPTLTKIKLSAEQELEIENMLVKCFPNMENDGSAP